MFRFFCPPENIFKDKIIITDKKEIHHILDVLRLKKGDRISIFDGKKIECKAILKDISSGKLILKIEEKNIKSPQEELEITIGCAIPKRKRFDIIVEKLTELGVKRIIPLETARSIIKLNKDKERTHQEHWQRIALNSSKQSGRIDIPQIDSQTKFREILSLKREYDLCLVCTISPGIKRIREVLEEKKPKRVFILIGPEGDFTSEEIEDALKEGFIPVSLGDLVLRTETAAIAVCSFLKLYANS